MTYRNTIFLTVHFIKIIKYIKKAIKNLLCTHVISNKKARSG